MRRLAAALLLAPIAALAQSPGLAGLWRTHGDDGKPEAMVRILEIDGEFRGRVVSVFSPPAESPNPRCERCEGELKDQPVVGMTILRGLRRDADAFSGGTILDPEDGKTYRCSARLVDGGRRLEMRGYLGVPLLGRTQVWVRAD